MAGQSTDYPLCRRCGRPVRVNRERYEVFEKMHWICFHFEFEHTPEFDPDEPCADPSCPWRRIAARAGADGCVEG